MHKTVIVRGLGLAICLTLFHPSPLFAQFSSVGVKGGVNLASQKVTNDDEADSGLTTFRGLVAGVFATLPIASRLELQPEALFVMKGSRFKEGGFTASVQLDYLEVPVLARFSWRGASRNGFYAAGGPYVAFSLRSRTRTTFSGSTEEIDISEDVERLDFGVAAGGGVERGRWVFDGRYTYGLKDVDKDKSDSVKVTNRGVSITAGYRF